MDQYLDDLKKIQMLSFEINQFFDSDLEFDAKMNHIDTLLEQRNQLINFLESYDIEKTEQHRNLLREIYDMDQLIIEKMNIYIHDNKQEIDKLKCEKIQVSKKRMVNKKYLTVSKESSGYFINQKR